MNKKNILISVLGLLVVLGLIWIARPGGTKNNPAVRADSVSKSTLTAQETSFDFGTVSMAAGNVKHDFQIKNTGNEPVVIRKMYTSCMCTTASLSIGGSKFGPYGMPGHGFIPSIDEVLAPGEIATASAVFDPNAHGPAGVGRIDRVITLENNTGAPLELKFSAVVTP